MAEQWSALPAQRPGNERNATTLLVADEVRTLAEPEAAAGVARAVLVDRDRIAWVGDPAEAPPHHWRMDLEGAFVQPAFVDAHIHLTPTGLLLGGLDLSVCRSVDDCLAALAA